MGVLYYGSESQPIEIPDRILLHLQVVTTTKLRRGESFTVSWRHPVGTDSGRTSIWMQPAIPLRFDFDTFDSSPLDREYLHELAVGANSASGLVLNLASEVTERELSAVESQPVAA